MNHLAHALLAAPDADCMFGSLIADFLRGRVDPALAPDVRAGIALHRAVDAFTDAHAEVAAARALFAPPYRRYAGILLDVWFDHLLARDWQRHVGTPSLAAFSRTVRDLLAARAAERPPRMAGFAAYLEANGLPERYREPAMIDAVLHGLGRRLSRANPVAGALPVLQALAAPLQRHFEAFLPDLAAHAARERARLAVAPPG
jgi:acyl carrier protein phosphodiesterase